MALHEVTASVIVEWYNMSHAELGRATRMLAELNAQSAGLFSAGEGAPVRLAKPLDLVIVCDSDPRCRQQVEAALDALPQAVAALCPRLMTVLDSSYCKLKNAGAASSHGEIIIFLDSDVVPEPRWLTGYLEAFVDPRVSVVVGNTYVDCDGPRVYPKAMALSWMFPLRDPSDRLQPSAWFYANNVAFRREAFVSRQFPDVPGSMHAPARMLVERLRREGEVIWHAGNARAAHPPPNGPLHFAMRAIAGGRARALCEPRPSPGAMIRWLRRDLGSIAWGCKRIVFSRSKVDLRWWQLPLAVVYPACYYTLFCLGSFLSITMPRMMRDRFDL